jgi:pSer/pThr/pTyr-binding forkhead associated (FHA) protein
MGPTPTTSQGPQLRLHTEPEPFQPLRLVLQPSGMVLEVTEPDVVVGRHSEAGLRLPLADVSRRHCRLTFKEGTWHLTDLNSLNGVQVNGEKVLESTLVNGDLLRIGGFTFAVEIGTCHVRSIMQTLDSTTARKAG